jgi:hypothetical protein
MAENDVNPWQVMARRPAPLAKLVESENERLLAARTPESAVPPTEDEPPVKPASTPETSDAADELG